MIVRLESTNDYLLSLVLRQGWNGLFEPLPRRQAGETDLRAGRRVATARPGAQIKVYIIVVVRKGERVCICH
ncbi:MAG: hypothetical protein KAR17_16895 [Cyclobacteriaceae bacterium]|nr:hypothetical protein [Cyclobacteriaceae bacterium]